jgi:hypothetical protein
MDAGLWRLDRCDERPLPSIGRVPEGTAQLLVGVGPTGMVRDKVLAIYWGREQGDS